MEIAYALIIAGIGAFIACMFLGPIPKSSGDPPRLFEPGDKFPPT